MVTKTDYQLMRPKGTLNANLNQTYAQYTVYLPFTDKESLIRTHDLSEYSANMVKAAA